MFNSQVADPSTRPQAVLSNRLLIGYFVAVAMVALLWGGLHGLPFDGAPKSGEVPIAYR